MAFCAVADCESLHYCKGYCVKHYSRWKKYGDPIFLMNIRGRLCSVVGCGQRHAAHGLCPGHLFRQNHGLPLEGYKPQHRWSGTATHRAWKSMMTRCYNPRRVQWKDWGGRGITVCDRWRGRNGFLNFLMDMGERPDGRSLDRRDNDGNYEPSNCRWATTKEQRLNQRKRVASVK